MNLAAALFVGGQSTRMGRDKALLEIGGAPLWSRQLELLRQLGPTQIFLSCRERPVWCPPELAAIQDEVSAAGPLGGLTASLAAADTSHLLALAIDLPNMNIAVLRELWMQAQPGCGVVPVIGDRFEPLCAVYPREALALARAAMEAGELSLQKLVRRLLEKNFVSIWPVPAEFARAFLNANSPADLTQL